MSEAKWQFPHRRWNPLRRQWILVSPHRTARPWQGEVNRASAFQGVSYDPECYLCPGNERVGGHRNPKYSGVFSFVNDFSALLPDSPAVEENAESPSGLLRAEQERGLCQVLCFHPDHSLTLARMEPKDIRQVIDAWSDHYQELGAKPWIQHVQIFENRGAMMGASNPHPHCQVWATEHIPDEPAAELASQREYWNEKKHCLLCDYLAVELGQAQRLVVENDHFVAVVPWWAVWPFETLVLSRGHLGSMPELTSPQRDGLADILKRLTTRYDNLFETSFPYTMGFHQMPTDGKDHPEWHFHAHFYPPLLRSASVRKFMVGFEMLGMPQRDITPESAAERLRALKDIHFTAQP